MNRRVSCVMARTLAHMAQPVNDYLFSNPHQDQPMPGPGRGFTEELLPIFIGIVGVGYFDEAAVYLSATEKAWGSNTVSNRRKVFSKVIGFLGAGIVLSTFVVKDVMREQVKELNDTVTSAETFYLTQTSINTIQVQMVELLDQVAKMSYRLSNPIPEDKSEEDVSAELAQYKTIQATTKVQVARNADLAKVNAEYMRNLIFLMGKIPHSESQRKEADSQLTLADQYAVKAHVLGEEADHSMQVMIDALNRFQSTGEVPSLRARAKLLSDAKNAQQRAKNFTEEGKIYAGRVKTLTDSVLEEVHNSEEVSESRYQRATQISYVLYALGWSLGLLGRLLGGDEAEASE